MTLTLGSITPTSGHTGGGQVVELLGVDFVVPPDPDPTGEPDALPATMAVLIGGAAAQAIAVVSSTCLYCRAHALDERVVSQVWTIPTTAGTFACATHGLLDGQVVRLEPQAGPLASPLAEQTAYWVRDRTAGTFRLAASSGGAALVVPVGSTGRVVSVGSYDVVVRSLAPDGSVLATSTLAGAYQARRPDLSQESHLARVMRCLIRWLKRQIMDNVVWTTHVDYDDQTGDLLSLAAPQRLPALVLTGVAIPDDPEYAAERNEQQETDADDDRFIARRPPELVMLTCDLVGVTDNSLELLNLLQAVRTCLGKTPWLAVDRSSTDPTQGTIEYPLEHDMLDGVSVTRGAGNSNIASFAFALRVRGIRLEDVPGVQATGPTGVPGTAHENTIEFGYQADDQAPDLDLQDG